MLSGFNLDVSLWVLLLSFFTAIGVVGFLGVTFFIIWSLFNND